MPISLFSPQFDLPAEEYADCLPDGELLALPLVVEEKNNETSGPGGPVPSPSLDFNDNEDIPTELSDSSETHDEGERTETRVTLPTKYIIINCFHASSITEHMKSPLI